MHVYPRIAEDVTEMLQDAKKLQLGLTSAMRAETCNLTHGCSFISGWWSPGISRAGAGLCGAGAVYRELLWGAQGHVRVQVFNQIIP